MKNYHLMAPADYPPDGDSRGFPGNFGGFLSTGWCDAKFWKLLLPQDLLSDPKKGRAYKI